MQRKMYFGTLSHDPVQKHDTLIHCREESDNFKFISKMFFEHVQISRKI